MNFLSASTLVFLIMSANASPSTAAIFNCSETQGVGSTVSFEYQKEKGFSFSKGAWVQPNFIGPKATLSNALATKFGRQEDIERVAVITTQRDIPFVQYYQEKGVSNDNGTVSEWKDMSGLDKYSETKHLIFSLKEFSLTIHTIVLGDVVTYGENSFQCALQTNMFDE